MKSTGGFQAYHCLREEAPEGEICIGTWVMSIVHSEGGLCPLVGVSAYDTCMHAFGVLDLMHVEGWKESPSCRPLWCCAPWSRAEKKGGYIVFSI